MWNAATEEQMQEVWEASEVAAMLPMLVLAMHEKGLLIDGRPAPTAPVLEDEPTN